MAYPKRAAAPTNTIKLTLDFDTLDRLKACAAERRIDSTRCIYELVQEALGVRSPPAVVMPPPEPEDEHTRAMHRGIEAIRNYKPQGYALTDETAKRLPTDTAYQICESRDGGKGHWVETAVAEPIVTAASPPTRRLACRWPDRASGASRRRSGSWLPPL